MKNSLLLFAVFTLAIATFFGCGNAQNKNNMSAYKISEDMPFTVSNAYFQEWAAGVENGGRGVNVSMEITGLNDATIDTFHFREMSIKATTTNLPNVFFGKFITQKADFIMDKDPMKEATNTANEAFQFKLATNEAVIEATVNGKKMFYSVKDMEEKMMIAYPSANPNLNKGLK